MEDETMKQQAEEHAWEYKNFDPNEYKYFDSGKCTDQGWSIIDTPELCKLGARALGKSRDCGQTSGNYGGNTPCTPIPPTKKRPAGCYTSSSTTHAHFNPETSDGGGVGGYGYICMREKALEYKYFDSGKCTDQGWSIITTPELCKIGARATGKSKDCGQTSGTYGGRAPCTPIPPTKSRPAGCYSANDYVHFN